MTKSQLIETAGRLMAGHWANGYYPTFGDVATDAHKLIQTCEYVHGDPKGAYDRAAVDRLLKEVARG